MSLLHIVMMNYGKIFSQSVALLTSTTQCSMKPMYTLLKCCNARTLQTKCLRNFSSLNVRDSQQWTNSRTFSVRTLQFCQNIYSTSPTSNINHFHNFHTIKQSFSGIKPVQDIQRGSQTCGRNLHSSSCNAASVRNIMPIDIKAVPKPKKKKKSRQSQDGGRKVVACATAHEYDLEKLKAKMTSLNWYNLSNLPDDMTDVIHATPKHPVAENNKEIFLFENGTVVFWDVPVTEVDELIKILRCHGNGTYDSVLSDSEMETLNFTLSSTDQTDFQSQQITLNTTNTAPETLLFQKYTCSNILSQSVKLAIWEIKVDEFVEQMEDLTKDLRIGKGLRMRRNDVLKNIGVAYEFRHNIHSSDLQDIPDFYWDREKLEQIYNKLHKIFSINKRIKVMLDKIDYCCDLLNLIDTKLTDEKHVRLEWMIIILIVIEVVFEMIRFADEHGFFPKF